MLPIDIIKIILKLVEENPNDRDLGSKIREIYWKYKENVKD
jgi:hypothetical protein